MPTLNNHVRRRGSFAPLSAHYYLDDALAQAGEAAELLYVRGLAFCAATLSDGFISDAQLARGPGVGMKDAEKRAAKLVEVGAWLREDNGWRVRTWLDWNRSRQEILDAAEVDRERKTRGGRAAPPPSPPGAVNGVPLDSDRNPNGIQSASGTTRAGRRARTPKNSTSTSNSTPLQDSGDVESLGDTWVADTAETITTPPAGGRPRATRIPQDFKITDAMITWADEHAPHADLKTETEQFRDYWHAKSGRDATKLDWTATWRTWIRKAEQQAGRQPTRRNGASRPSTTDRAVADVFALGERLKQRALDPGETA